MERKRLAWVAGVCGAVFAVSVAVFAWQLTAAGSHAAGSERTEPSVKVLTCASSIGAGDRITDLNVSPVSVPKSLVPDGALLASEMGKVKGRRVAAGMSRGEILTQLRVGTTASPLDRVQPGYTAITVSVDPVRALGGEATSGMRVDLMVEEAIGTVTTIASDIRIISTSIRQVEVVDSSLMAPSNGAGADITWVTLEVPDESVDAVVAASAASSVYLVLPAMNLESYRG